MILPLQERLRRILRWSERYTKTDMVYLASGGFWLTLKTVIAILVAFAMSTAFANLLPQHIFGAYKYVFSILGLLAIPTLMGMGTSVTRAVARGYDGTVLAALRTKVRWGMLGSAASMAIGIYYYMAGNTELGFAFALSALFLPFVDTLGIFNTLLLGKQRFRASLVEETFVQSISAAAIITTLFFTDSLLYVLAAYFTSYTATRSFVLWRVLRKHAANNSVDAGAIGYGKHLSVMEVLATLAEALDSILLWQFLGPGPVAVFAFAKAIPLQMVAALKKLPSMALPRFAQRDFKSISQSIFYRIFLLMIPLSIIVLAYIAAAPYIYATFFPLYTDAVFYSQLLALTVLFFPKKILGAIFNAHGDKKALYTHSIASPLVKITLSVTLIPMFGILGAVLAEIAAQLFGLILLTVLFLRAKARFQAAI